MSSFRWFDAGEDDSAIERVLVPAAPVVLPLPSPPVSPEPEAEPEVKSDSPEPETEQPPREEEPPKPPSSKCIQYLISDVAVLCIPNRITYTLALV